MGPSNKLINSNISIMICMIFTLRLPKTKWVYTFYVTSPIIQDPVLTKKFLPLFLLTFTDKVTPINMFHKMHFHNSSSHININSCKIYLNIKLIQSWVYHFHVQRDNHIENSPNCNFHDMVPIIYSILILELLIQNKLNECKYSYSNWMLLFSKTCIRHRKLLFSDVRKKFNP